jgi:pyruvate-formate lyase-activating enzyme
MVQAGGSQQAAKFLFGKKIRILLEKATHQAPAVGVETIARVADEHIAHLYLGGINHLALFNTTDAETGHLDEVLGNVAFLKESKVPHVLRVPVVPGVNDSASDRAAFLAIAGASPVEFLPYNPAAGAKYPLFGRDYPFADKGRGFF